MPAPAKSHSTTGKPPATLSSSRRTAATGNVGNNAIIQRTIRMPTADVDHGRAAATAITIQSAKSRQRRRLNKFISSGDFLRFIGRYAPGVMLLRGAIGASGICSAEIEGTALIARSELRPEGLIRQQLFKIGNRADQSVLERRTRAPCQQALCK